MCGVPLDPISFEQATKEIWQRLVAHAGLDPMGDHSTETQDELAALHEEADLRVLGLITQEELRRWTEVGKDWKCPTRQNLEHIIFTHRPGEPWGLYVDRQELADVAAARWPNDLAGYNPQRTSQPMVQSSNRKRGRTPGTGTYAKSDEALYPEMKRRIECGDALSVHAAAKQVAPQARGPATEASKTDRLRKGYRKWEFGD